MASMLMLAHGWIERTGKEMSYHPDYGYPDAYRLRVCHTAIILGKKAAVKKHEVSITSVYNWLKVYSFDAIMRGGKENGQG